MKDEDKQNNYERAAKLLSEENFVAALIAGAVAMLIGAFAYSMFGGARSFGQGFAVAGIGVLVGAAMGFLGRGISSRFDVLAAVYTVGGYLLGNLARTVSAQARDTATSVVEVLTNTPLATLAGWLFSDFYVIDIVFLLVAVVAAVFLAKRALSRADRLALGMYRMRGPVSDESST